MNLIPGLLQSSLVSGFNMGIWEPHPITNVNMFSSIWIWSVLKRGACGEEEKHTDLQSHGQSQAKGDIDHAGASWRVSQLGEHPARVMCKGMLVAVAAQTRGLQVRGGN